MQPQHFISAITDFCSLAYARAVEKGFYVDPPKPLERFALMHEELGEASSWHRKGNPPSDHIPEFSGEEEELADTMIRIADYAKSKNYRLGEAIVAKMTYNQSRPYKHGKNC